METVHHDAAMAKAEGEYEKIRVKQDKEYISEFDSKRQLQPTYSNPVKLDKIEIPLIL